MNIHLLLKDAGSELSIVNVSRIPFNVKNNISRELIEMECQDTDWIIRYHEQYKCREPSYDLGIATEFRAKRQLFQEIKQHIGKRPLLKEKDYPIEAEKNGMKYVLGKHSFSFRT